MAKPTIVTRAGKGSALTWTEGDANLTNLQNATITMKAGIAPVDTDVVSDLNGTVQIMGGTDISVTGNNSSKEITINYTGTAFDPASPGAIGGTTKAAGTFTTMTADVAVLDDIRETVAALTYGATITPNAADGSIRSITLTGNVTFSAFTSPVSGQTITLIITQDATGSRTLTSTMKFAGGSKTLSTAANAIDILTVSYIGTTYYASLVKGFA
jgi:hypothetical protein